jgi:2-succinyl-5-enolpyruvyl-6-hydroxy-3-cyclohexene-1-carboxylate synthase
MTHADIQSTFCATLVDEWARCGVTDAVIAPGSRSAPLALALAADDRIAVHVHTDERSAGFMALGISLSTWEPTVVLTTSGTAAVELHPAVVEADLAGLPLLVCTADRPPELRDVGAPQAIDQAHLFGRSPRWYHDPGVPDEAMSTRWRAIAGRAYAEATGSRPGPVHLNLPFREPLVGDVGDLPAAREATDLKEAWVWRPPAQAPADPVLDLAEDLAGKRGVILAGRWSGNGEWVHDLADALGWPVLADPLSVSRVPTASTVAHADAILRSDLAKRELAPEIVLRLGEAPASRVVNEWVAASGALEIVVAGAGRWSDPSGTAGVVLDVDAPDLLQPLLEAKDDIEPIDEWQALWTALDAGAAGAISGVLDVYEVPSEPGTAREVLASLPDGAQLVVSSSMPIRDLEWYGAPRGGVRVHANRGANGIDGVVSTAVGVAIGSAAPTVALLGDLAFIHDSNGLLAAVDRGIDLVVVVSDNDGGGIFSFLPHAGAVGEERFEQVFGTPHGIDLVALAAAYGVTATATTDVGDDVASALEAGGVHVIVVRTDRRTNVELHDRIHAAAVTAVDAVLA